MGFFEKLNRVLISCLTGLVLIQIGLLFFLKSLQDEAQFKLVKNTSKAKISCGENQFSEENYWKVASGDVKSHSLCTFENCDKSSIFWNRSEQDKDLHLVSVMSPPPLQWDNMEQGGVVRLHIKKSDKPQILALVSRSPLEWKLDLEKGAQIEKLIVATPTTVWIQGVATTVPIEYLPKEKMCNYPFAWEEALNPDNDFRALAGALQKITGLQLNSFQGAQVGKEFWLPLKENREPSSVTEMEKRQLASKTSSAIQWQRQEGHVVADKYVTQTQQSIPLPPRTVQALEVQGEVYAVVDGLLRVWKKDHFEALHSPLTLADVGNVQGLAYDRDRQALIIYNDERSGEFYHYSLKDKSWSLFKEGFKYNLASMVYDSESREVIALTSRGQYFTGLVSFSADGKNEKFQELKVKSPFDRKRWRLQLEKQESQWRVQVISPQSLNGETWALN